MLSEPLGQCLVVKVGIASNVCFFDEQLVHRSPFLASVW